MTTSSIVSPRSVITLPAQRVLIFDSGIGGLSVVLEIQRLLPQLELVYASDNKAFPYGIKPGDELINRVCTVLDKLTKQLHPDLVVVACNTASTLVLPIIRNKITVPVIGVVPAIKSAARTSRTRVIGLLATPATIGRGYTHKLIAQFGADCQWLPLGSSALVELAENKLYGATVDLDRLKDILQPLMDHHLFEDMDTVVLGCTHFPFVKEELQAACRKPLHWIDSGYAIAQRVMTVLADHNTYAVRQIPHNQAIFTLALDEYSCLLNVLSKLKFREIIYI